MLGKISGMKYTKQKHKKCHRSRTERERLLEQFDAAGVSQAEFCRDIDLLPCTLSHWLRRRAKNNLSSVFREVVLPVAEDEVSLRLSCGVTISAGVSIAARLIRALEQC